MSSRKHIYTALNVPTVTAYPSAQCLQWSQDGQLFLTTKAAVYILTPGPGISFDTASSVKSLPKGQDLPDHLSLGWFRTAVQANTVSVAYHWPEYSNSWATITLGSIDVDLIASVLSPSGVSPSGGCILAILNTNLDLTLWSSSANMLKGPWIKIFDVVPFLLESFFSPQNDEERTAMTLKCQITSVAWTPEVRFEFQPSPAATSSLLLLGTRSGSIHILRYTIPSSLQLLQTVPITEKWITHLVASPWSVNVNNSYESIIMFGLEDGGTGHLRIRQALRDAEMPSPFGFETALELVVAPPTPGEWIIAPNGAPLTGATWITLRDRRLALICHKPGVVYLWSPHPGAWSGQVALKVTPVPTSIGSTPHAPLSGVQYLADLDVVVLSTFDGSFHVIQDISHSPSWAGEGARNVESILSDLAGDVRDICAKVEGRKLHFSDTLKVPGSVSYDGYGTMVWAYEISQPALLTYKHEAQTYIKLVVADVTTRRAPETIVQALEQTLHIGQTGRAVTPLHILRPIFFSIRQEKNIGSMFSAILRVLQVPLAMQPTPHLPLCSPPLIDLIRSSFRNSLRTHLFGWDHFSFARMRLSVADFIYLYCPTEQLQQECAAVAQNWLTKIAHLNLQCLIRHVAAASHLFTEQDIPFVLRLIIQSTLPETPSDLRNEGQGLASTIQTISDEPLHALLSGDGFKETCPACGANVPLTDISKAACENGHSWARCSVTTFILSTSFLRTCIGCSRKAFLPLSSRKPAPIRNEDLEEGDLPGASSSSATVTTNWLPAIGRGWMVEELLEAVDHCLFCGNHFASVL